MPGKNSVNKKKKSNRGKVKDTGKEEILEAHKLAELDIKKDPDLSTKHEKGDDLDEGELAQLDNNI